MFYFSIIFSSFRSIVYCFDLNFYWQIGIILELIKGLSSSFFNYSSLRIFKNFGMDKNLSTAQSIHGIIHNGISYIFSSILGYFIFQDQLRIREIKMNFMVVGVLALVTGICGFFYKFFNRNKKNINEPKKAEMNNLKL